MPELVTVKRADRDNIAISNEPTKKKNSQGILEYHDKHCAPSS